MARCKNQYALPIKQMNIKSFKKKSPTSHIGKLKHSLDFYCDEGTPIHAATGGIVVWVKDNSKEGGPHKRYWFKGNRIVIRHKIKEYTAYEHLRYKGVKVKVGERVRKFQVIGYSGNTGFTTAPHLHFEVFTNPSSDESEGITLQVFFKELKRK